MGQLRRDYIDKLRDVLEKAFPDEQELAQLSLDDIAAVFNALLRVNHEFQKEIERDEWEAAYLSTDPLQRSRDDVSSSSG